MGIEPTLSGRKHDILPLNYTRISFLLYAIFLFHASYSSVFFLPATFLLEYISCKGPPLFNKVGTSVTNTSRHKKNQPL